MCSSLWSSYTHISPAICCLIIMLIWNLRTLLISQPQVVLHARQRYQSIDSVTLQLYCRSAVHHQSCRNLFPDQALVLTKFSHGSVQLISETSLYLHNLNLYKGNITSLHSLLTKHNWQDVLVHVRNLSCGFIIEAEKLVWKTKCFPGWGSGKSSVMFRMYTTQTSKHDVRQIVQVDMWIVMLVSSVVQMQST